jgi:ubiquinol-cytochrome c reductase cytochrome b subunit
MRSRGNDHIRATADPDRATRPARLRLLRWLDEQLGSASLAKAAFRRVFPDHWSFLLGHIALFSFVVIVLSGVYLTFFFTPDTRQTVYDGPYAPLHGARVSAAFDSVMRLSFEVRAGLVMRQIHHWAALVFMAAIVVHLCRVFFTGAFRRPRQLNYLIGFALLVLGLADGLTGYSLPDDLLSGISLRIIYSGVLGIPLIGTWLAYLFFGGEYPTPDLIARFYVFHVMLLPILLMGMLLVHLALVVWQRHTQFPGPGRTERNVVGKRLWPEQAFKYTAIGLLTGGVLALLGGLAQINPVWTYGPSDPFAATAPAQPDWYTGWLDGALRLAPPWDFDLFGYTISELFLPGIVLPGLLLALVAVWPFIEARFTKDRREHHLLDRPRDVPFRTATGIAGLSVFFVLFLAGGDDVIGTLLHVPVETIIRILQVTFFVAPVVCWVVTYVVCTGLRDTGAHPGRPTAGLLLRRSATGAYEMIPADDTGDGGGEPVVRRSASSAPRHTPPAHGMPEE